MDHRDANCRRMEEIYDQLHSAYSQFGTSSTQSGCFGYPGQREHAQSHPIPGHKEHVQSRPIPFDLERGLHLFNDGDFTFIFKL